MDVFFFRYCLLVHMSKQNSQHCNKDQDQQMLGSVLQTFEEQPGIVHHPPRAHLQAIPQRGVLLHSPCIYCHSLVTLQRGVLWQCCQIFQIAPVTPRLPPGSMELLVPCHHSSALPSYVIVMLDLGEQLPLYWGDVLLPLCHSHWVVFWNTHFHAPAIYAHSLYSATGTFCWSEVGGLWFWL